MEFKNIVVVCYSRTGHSRKIGEEIARSLGCEFLEIRSLSAYPQGAGGFIKALWHLARGRNVPIQVDQGKFSNFDLIVVGGPMWFGGLSVPLRSFLSTYKNEFNNIAFYCTQGGKNGEGKYFQQMTKVCGKNPIATLTLGEKEMQNESYHEKVNSFVLGLGPVKKAEPRRVSAREKDLEI